MNVFHRCSHVAAALLVALVTFAHISSASTQVAGYLRHEYQQISRQFDESVFDWRPEAPAIGSLLFVAPDQYTPAERKGDSLQAERKEYADELFALAKRAAAAGQLSLAFQWATEAVRENPDHAEARRVLGYERRDGKWLTSYGARMSDAGKEWHPKLGWLAVADVPRYEAGERLLSKRWVSAEDDAARHRDMRSGWQVRTDHFLVTTNHSLQAGAELAARLERLHQVWRQLFAGFYLTEREVQGLFAGERPPRKQARPFRVYYHRDRDEYAGALRRRQPRIGDTLGIYFDANREAHFFAGDGWDRATLYHEAVHQLFQETRPATRHVGATGNFWVVEGIATYFETLREHRDARAGLYYTIGESSAGRLPAAKRRLLAEKFYVPLDELLALSKDDLQRYPELAKLYSQSAGLAALLMDGEEGRYREPLVVYLTAVYAGRDDEKSLSEATGTTNSELDAAYRRYLESLP